MISLFDRYKNKQDFIQKYIFPGGFLPSKNIINKYVSENGLTINHMTLMQIIIQIH